METQLRTTERHQLHGITYHKTCQPTQVNMLRLNPRQQTSTRFTNPEKMEKSVDLGARL